MSKNFLFLCFLSVLTATHVHCQNAQIQGTLLDESGSAIPMASVKLDEGLRTYSDSSGFYVITALQPGPHKLLIKSYGFQTSLQEVHLKEGVNEVNVILQPHIKKLKEVVISGTLKEVSKTNSPVNVEVYSESFFKKNPTPNIFDALQNINGVRPQLNCQVCNTGDIHINGLEGPYTMVLIDGMPIVSSLSTVYGLSGIPNAMIERVEIVKGPASSLYGSEAVGGLINIITKSPQRAMSFSADVFGTSWGEINADLGFKNKVGQKAEVLTGVNFFLFDNVVDNDEDGFTDITLQERFSIFQKWQLHRKSGKHFSVAARYLTEDRWGGETHWTPEFRGGTDIYGENILTRRWEFLTTYEFPTKEHLRFQGSFNAHDQNSAYANTLYLADQKVAFGQFLWDRQMGKHDLLTGLALRHSYYDDNTPATEISEDVIIRNNPESVWLPGIFLQDNIQVTNKNAVLLGARYDYNSHHGNIFTPRIAWKWKPDAKHVFRLNAGTGFRVVNLFTEDHAALTGAREVIITEDLNPEESYNVNLNFVKKIYPSDETFVGIDASVWYTHFTNQIIPDYDTDPNQIIYNNLNGVSRSTGISVNLDLLLGTRWTLLLGGTVMDVSFEENGTKERPFLTENWTGTWTATYLIPKWHLSLDYTGNLYGPMRLPVLGELDPRQPYSPVWSQQNIQFSYQKPGSLLSLFGGVKNLLNWTPNRNNPFLIARTDDPFDENVQFDGDGNVIATSSNPYALTFDPTYVYAPNQGIRFFVGLRVHVR